MYYCQKKYLQKPDKSLNSIVWAYKAKEPLSESQDENRVEKGLVYLMLPNVINKKHGIKGRRGSIMAWAYMAFSGTGSQTAESGLMNSEVQRAHHSSLISHSESSSGVSEDKYVEYSALFDPHFTHRHRCQHLTDRET